jgi:hypothetical protein
VEIKNDRYTSSLNAMHDADEDECKHGMVCCEPCAYDRGRLAALREVRGMVSRIMPYHGGTWALGHEEAKRFAREQIDHMIAKEEAGR